MICILWQHPVHGNFLQSTQHCRQVSSTNSMEVLEWQAVSVQHLVCPVAERVDVECTGIHTAFIVPHTIPSMCAESSTCPASCPASSIPFPANTTIINGDVYSHATSRASSATPSLFAAAFDCPAGVHTLAGNPGSSPSAHTVVCARASLFALQRTYEPKSKRTFGARYVGWTTVSYCRNRQ